jgi:hypothetical protein
MVQHASTAHTAVHTNWGVACMIAGTGPPPYNRTHVYNAANRNGWKTCCGDPPCRCSQYHNKHKHMYKGSWCHAKAQ